MNDLSKTISEVLSSDLSDPEAIAGVIRQTEADLAEVEARLSETEALVLSAATSDEQAEELSKQAAVLRLMAQRKAAALDKLRAAHASAVLRQAKAEAEERRRQVIAERDQVAKDLAARYPALAAELAALLARVMASEAQCKAVNVPGPEATARTLGPGDFGKLTRGTILPAWDLRQAGFWPPSRPRSTVSVLPQAVLERSAELGDMARETMEANLRAEARIRGQGPLLPEAELSPAKLAH